MKRRDFAFMAMASIAVSGCSTFARPRGPEVTSVVVNKAPRRMYLMHNTGVLRAFDCGLGFAPEGHKQFQGDGRTPEGTYLIDRRNPQSKYYLSVGIDYPNAQDVAFARAHGRDPGGDIFIHGQPNTFRPNKRDWTWGCIAVTNHEMDEIYHRIVEGTPITIRP